ncbi:MAG: hypothetical protein H3C43_04790 [Leptonema sp. (in: Bacteria)]|nr:hypothetical protein [Leptonema sp. (in: bacteria)]
MGDTDDLSQQTTLLSYNDSVRFLSNPKASTIRPTDETVEHLRFCSFIYDAIQSLTENSKTKFESYYPSEKEIYDDIQERKRAISDRVPMPPPEEMLRISLLLTDTTPPAVYVLREFTVIESKLKFITKYVAATVNETNRAKQAIDFVIHNSIVTIKSHLIHIDFNRVLQQKTATFSNIQDLSSITRLGRVDQILADIYLRKSDLGISGETDLLRLQKVNQTIRDTIFRPIVTQLTQARIAAKISLDEMRTQSGRVLPDVILFNNLNFISARLQILSDLLVTKPVLQIVESLMPQGFSTLVESDDRKKIAALIATKVLELARSNLSLPDSLIELCAERLAIESFLGEAEKQDQIETDRQEMQKLLQTLKIQKGIFRAKHGPKLLVNERVIDYIVRGLYSGIVVATEPPSTPGQRKNKSAKDYRSIYFLLKDREATARSIEQAENLYNKMEDIVLIRLLEQMTEIHEKSDEELKDLIAPAYTDRFRELIGTTYLQKLPFWSRIWYLIRGQKPSKKQQKLFYDAYLNSFSQIPNVPTKTKASATAKSQLSQTQNRSAQNQLDNKLKEVLNIFIGVATNYWSKGQHPDKQILLESINRPDQKTAANQLFSFIHAGAQSTKDLIEIRSPKQESVYAPRQFLLQNLTGLLERYQRRMTDFDGYETDDGVKVSMQYRTKDKALTGAILQLLHKLETESE